MSLTFDCDSVRAEAMLAFLKKFAADDVLRAHSIHLLCERTAGVAYTFDMSRVSMKFSSIVRE